MVSIIAIPQKMLEFTVNMQKVRRPIWSKLTSYRVVRFIVTPTQTQTATTMELIMAPRHLFLVILCSVFICSIIYIKQAKNQQKMHQIMVSGMVAKVVLSTENRFSEGR